jgi:hypothetical protein
MITLACEATLENAARLARVRGSGVRGRVKDPEFQHKTQTLGPIW